MERLGMFIFVMRVAKGYLVIKSIKKFIKEVQKINKQKTLKELGTIALWQKSIKKKKI